MRSMNAPLQGVRVLVTRASEGGDALSALLRRRGADVREVPLTRIGPPPDERSLQAAVDSADEFDWLVFTSANAVRSVSARRRAQLAQRVRLAAVGPATAQAIADELGARPVLQPERFVAEALADKLAHEAPAGSTMLLVQAADARPALAARLRAGGMHVTTVIGYMNLPLAPDDIALRVKDCAVVTLTSGSAVRALVEGLGGNAQAAAQLRGTLLACIGPVTEHEARARGLHVELVAPAASFESLVDALCIYYSSRHP